MKHFKKKSFPARETPTPELCWSLTKLFALIRREYVFYQPEVGNTWGNLPHLWNNFAITERIGIIWRRGDLVNLVIFPANTRTLSWFYTVEVGGCVCLQLPIGIRDLWQLFVLWKLSGKKKNCFCSFSWYLLSGKNVTL